MTSSGKSNTPRRRVAGERRRPRDAGSEPAVDQSAPVTAVVAVQTTAGTEAPSAEAPTAEAPTAEAPTAEVRAGERPSASGVRPGWIVAGLALLLAATALVMSLVMWRAAEDVPFAVREQCVTGFGDGSAETDRRHYVLQCAPPPHMHVHVAGRGQQQAVACAERAQRCEFGGVVGTAMQLD